MLATELRPRIGVENRLPEFIEEAMYLPQLPADLLQVLRRTSQAAVEHLSERFFRCMRREECDRIMDIVKELGAPAQQQMREMLRTGQPRQAASVVGLLSRLDVPTLLELLPTRLPEWNRFYHDVVVRQIAYGAAHDRGRSLLELLEILDPLVLPQAIDEIGMSGDRTAVPPLVVMAEAGEAQGRSALIQLKAVESLGRLRENDAVPVLRGLLEAKKMWRWSHHRELRIAAAQALVKIDPRYGSQVMAESGLEPGELAIAPLDSAPACPWVRQRRYERIVLRRTLPATISSSWGKSSILIRELSLGGGMGTKEDNLRVGSEANIDIAAGVRHIRGQVLLRRARVNEVGFEIVNTDLESRYRLRRILMDSLEHASGTKEGDWDGQRKPQSDRNSRIHYLKKPRCPTLFAHFAKGWIHQRLFNPAKASLLYLREDNNQRVKRQRLDQRQTKNQRQLNAGTGRRIASQSFRRRGRGFPWPRRAQAGSNRHRKSGGDGHPVVPAASPPCANAGTAKQSNEPLP